MNLSKLKPIAAILSTSLIAFITHSILFKLLQKPTIENSFYYSNIELYSFLHSFFNCTNNYTNYNKRKKYR